MIGILDLSDFSWYCCQFCADQAQIVFSCSHVGLTADECNLGMVGRFTFMYNCVVEITSVCEIWFQYKNVRLITREGRT